MSATTPTDGLPIRTVPLGADVELCAQAVEDPTHRGQLVIDVRLYRREVAGAALAPTAAGFRVAVHMAGLAADAIRTVAVRTAEHCAFVPFDDAQHERQS